MSTYHAQVEWRRNEGEPFTDRRYHRGHWLRFDGGAVVAGSSSPLVVPRYSDEAAVDPEELFVASLSSCHMLWFLDFAARAGWCVDAYEDDAEGTFGKNAEGRWSMTEVVLRPRVSFGDNRAPALGDLLDLHERAHEACYIANSVKTDVRCEPRP